MQIWHEFREEWPRWRGQIEVVVRDLDGRITERLRFPNLITNAGMNLARDMLGGYVTNAKIGYVAIGTSGTAPAVTDTQLGVEVFRKQLTSVSQPGIGQVTTVMWLGPQDSAGTVIAELGWFAGAGATATANSGVLISHVLYAHTHTNSESIQITRTDTL